MREPIVFVSLSEAANPNIERCVGAKADDTIGAMESNKVQQCSLKDPARR
jgi:hypothetical protein